MRFRMAYSQTSLRCRVVSPCHTSSAVGRSSPYVKTNPADHQGYL